MTDPASLATVETMMGLDWEGKEAVASRGEVMRDPSVTQRMGSKEPSEGSMLAALSKTDIDVERTELVERLARQLVSEALHESCEMK